MGADLGLLHDANIVANKVDKHKLDCLDALDDVGDTGEAICDRLGADELEHLVEAAAALACEDNVLLDIVIFVLAEDPGCLGLVIADVLDGVDQRAAKKLVKKKTKKKKMPTAE